MKIVCYGESPADQAAMAVFAEGILGAPLEVIDMGLEGHGVGGVLSTLGSVFLQTYYRSDADGLMVVMDSDTTELHEPTHDTVPGGSARCRLCQARTSIERAQKQVKAIPGRAGLNVAIGLAVPAIEAWYLVGKERQVGEPAWKVGLQAGRPPFTSQRLKDLVYQRARPSLEYLTESAVREARRIIADIKAIETAFPVGFGSMAEQMRTWIV